ncbi:MAG: diguanylate cyclase response regulator [Salinisphaeraceae bacterium]|nr:diguanylate cyclase response regulator [Salinisphaeraceae bacterium]
MPDQPKILVVDDLKANRMAMRHLLAGLDIQLHEAASGNEALMATLDHDYALILLDVQMAGMDGFEVAELLRGEARTRAVPIIFVTAALTEELDSLKGCEVGAVDYITKPVNETILLAKVRSFLELYRTRRELESALARLDEKNATLQAEIAERTRAEEAARFQATHDALTGLPNRLLLFDRLETAIERSRRNQRNFALGYLDLDGFKQVNDGLGHAARDALLVEAARRLRSGIRASDTVARLGGDEFAVIFDNVADVAAAETLGGQLWERLTGPMTLPDAQATAEIGASLGLALYPLHGTTADEIMGQADAALYAVKRAGKGGYKLRESGG